MTRELVVAILAKHPVEGRVKTRLTPVLSTEQAAEFARRCLVDTMNAVARFDPFHCVVALDGAPDLGFADLVEVPNELRSRTTFISQGEGSFEDRLDRLWDTCRQGWPGFGVIQVGMDTPQLGQGPLADFASRLVDLDPASALIGPALDGGWWALGLHRYRTGIFDQVPWSVAQTSQAQGEQLQRCGYVVHYGDPLLDVDYPQDAFNLAEAYPELSSSQWIASLADQAFLPSFGAPNAR